MPTSRSLAPFRAVIRPLALAQHEVEVEIHLPKEAVVEPTVMTLPAWTPGSYLVRDYARLLDRLRLTDARGRELPVLKLDKQSWQLPALPAGGVLRYRLFCNDLTVRTNHVDATHAQLVGAATFLYSEAEPQRPWEVRFEGFPEGWGVATALPLVKGAFLAPDHDTLVDSPFELGRFTLHAWKQDGVRYEFAVTGERRIDEDRLVDGTKRLIDVCHRLFGGAPFTRYAFLLTFSPGARGGLEHRDCTSLLADPHRMDTPEGWHDLFMLIGHEFFHAWNVKRLRAPELGPFHYAGETYTRLLWFHEGFTSLLQYVLVLKAGLVPWPFVAGRLSQLWTEDANRAGRLEQSLEESSFDAWIRFYRPNEFSANSTVSYYDRGALVAWMLDARIRLATRRKAGLEDLFRLLWERHGDGPVADGEIRAAVAELTGKDPAPFWKGWIQGREALVAKDLEAAYGLVFEVRAPWELLPAGEREDPVAVARAKAWTGLVVGADGRVQNVVPGSPAAEAGLTYGMEVLAVDGWRTATGVEVTKRLSEVGTGRSAQVLASHRGRVATHRVKVAVNPQRTLRVVADPKATPAQRAAFLAFTGLPHPAEG